MARAGGWVTSYVYGELPADPDKLTSVVLELLDANLMSLPDIDGIAAKVVDDLEVMPEHIGMLVIFGGDVLLDCTGKGGVRRLAKGDGEDVVAAEEA